MQREPRNRYRDDHKIQTPLQKNLVVDDGEEEEDLDPEIHCLGDTSSSPHLTQLAYKESLMDNQLNKLSKGGKANDNPNRYNLRSKNKGEKHDVPNWPTKVENPTKEVENSSKEKKTQNPPLVAKFHIPEVREILKPPSYFNFEHEIQKIRIPVPFHNWSSMNTLRDPYPNCCCLNPQIIPQTQSM
jgi:hypothetical protein